MENKKYKLDYTVDLSKLNKDNLPKEDEESNARDNLKTRASMQQTVLSGIQIPQNPNAPVATPAPQTEGWGQTGA